MATTSTPRGLVTLRVSSLQPPLQPPPNPPPTRLPTPLRIERASTCLPHRPLSMKPSLTSMQALGTQPTQLPPRRSPVHFTCQPQKPSSRHHPPEHALLAGACPSHGLPPLCAVREVGVARSRVLTVPRLRYRNRPPMASCEHPWRRKKRMRSWVGGPLRS